jgi:hypothetical protein
MLTYRRGAVTIHEKWIMVGHGPGEARLSGWGGGRDVRGGCDCRRGRSANGSGMKPGIQKPEVITASQGATDVYGRG